MGLVVALDPVTSVTDCPNYGGSGNASAFNNEAWDLYLPLLALAWIAAVIVEQFLPYTRRSPIDTTLRATAAISISIVASCCGVGQFLVVCH